MASSYGAKSSIDTPTPGAGGGGGGSAGGASRAGGGGGPRVSPVVVQLHSAVTSVNADELERVLRENKTWLGAPDPTDVSSTPCVLANAPDEQGRPPLLRLYELIHAGQVDSTLPLERAIRTLLAHKASPSASDRRGLSPLHLALTSPSVLFASIDATESSATVPAPTTSAALPAAPEGFTSCYEDIKNMPHPKGPPPPPRLFSIVLPLLQGGANMNCTDEEGDTPLMSMLGRWGLALQSLAPVSMALDLGADPLIANRHRHTALSIVLSLLHVEFASAALQEMAVTNVERLVALLLERGAVAQRSCGGCDAYITSLPTVPPNPTLTALPSFDHAPRSACRHRTPPASPCGAVDRICSPLHLALAHQTSKRTVELLLMFGANVNASDSAGKRPLDIVQNKVHEALLLSAGAKRQDLTTMLHDGALEGDEVAIETALRLGVYVNARQKETSATPLHMAINSRNPQAVAKLLQYNADPNVTDADGNTPLHAACGASKCRAIVPEIVKLLIDNGAKPQIQNRVVALPLHIACSSSLRYDEEVATVIKESPATWALVVDKGDGAGNTPLMLAAQHTLPHTLNALLSVFVSRVALDVQYAVLHRSNQHGQTAMALVATGGANHAPYSTIVETARLLLRWGVATSRLPEQQSLARFVLDALAFCDQATWNERYSRLIKLGKYQGLVPPSSASECLKCRTQFGFFSQKCQCRCCGFIYCKDCKHPRNIVVLQIEGPRPVCARCAIVLEGIRNNTLGAEIERDFVFLAKPNGTTPGDNNKTPGFVNDTLPTTPMSSSLPMSSLSIPSVSSASPSSSPLNSPAGSSSSSFGSLGTSRSAVLQHSSSASPGPVADLSGIPKLPRLRYPVALAWFPLMHQKLRAAANAIRQAQTQSGLIPPSVRASKAFQTKLRDLFAAKAQLLELQRSTNGHLAMLESFDGMEGVTARCLESIEQLEKDCELSESNQTTTTTTTTSTSSSSSSTTPQNEPLYPQTTPGSPMRGNGGENEVGNSGSAMPALPQARLPLQWTWVQLTHKKLRVSASYLQQMHQRGTLVLAAKPVREAIADCCNARSQFSELLKNEADVQLLSEVDAGFPHVLDQCVSATNRIFEECGITPEGITMLALSPSANATVPVGLLAAGASMATGTGLGGGGGVGSDKALNGMHGSANGASPVLLERHTTVIPPIPRITYPLEWAWLPLMHKKIRAASIYLGQLHDSGTLGLSSNAKGVRAATSDLAHGRQQLKQLCANEHDLESLRALDATLPDAVRACRHAIKCIFAECNLSEIESLEALSNPSASAEEALWRRRAEELLVEAEQLTLEIAIGISDTSAAYLKLEQLLVQIDSDMGRLSPAEVPSIVVPQYERLRQYVISSLRSQQPPSGTADTTSHLHACQTAESRFEQLAAKAAAADSTQLAKDASSELAALESVVRKLRASLPALEQIANGSDSPSPTSSSASSSSSSSIFTTIALDPPIEAALLKRVDDLLERIADTQRVLSSKFQLSQHNLLQLGRMVGMKRQISKATANHQALDDEMFEL